MGALVADKFVPYVQALLNLRFAPGDPLIEMAALHKEFSIFTERHTLATASALLNIAPPEANERKGWFQYLDNLKRVGSDVAQQNGHDRAMTALRDNLESKEPQPVFFTWHPGKENSGILVKVSEPFAFSATKYLIISTPIGG